jgi:hypothetical protein
MSESTAAACWICLDDGPDDAGKPTVRDCSCRGSYAGFAHISCIVEYATRKSLEDRNNSNRQDFQAPWVECPNCNQHYNGQLKRELIDKFVKFVEDKHSEFDWRRLTAYSRMFWEKVDDHDELVSKCVSICDKLENGEYDPLSIHPEEIMGLIIMTHYKIGISETKRGIDDHHINSAKKGIKHLERARDISEKSGNTPLVLQIDPDISSYTRRCFEKFGPKFGKIATLEEELEKLRAAYESCIDRFEGSLNDVVVVCGKEYARALLRAKRRIKAWRLLDKLIPSCQQIHGSEHEQTLYLKKMFDMVHCVSVRNQGYDIFRALGYEGDQCVVQGPVQQPRIPSEEKVLKVTVHDDNVILDEGAPVICHGLKNAAYLNGKVGESRGYDDKAIGIRYQVFFDDENISPKSVKPENLRILFELPETSTEA